MADKNKIDDVFRKALTDYEAPYDNAAWADFQKKAALTTNAGKLSKIFSLNIFTGLLVAVLAGTAFWYFKIKDNKAEFSETVPAVTNTAKGADTNRNIRDTYLSSSQPAPAKKEQAQPLAEEIALSVNKMADNMPEVEIKEARIDKQVMADLKKIKEDAPKDVVNEAKRVGHSSINEAVNTTATSNNSTVAPVQGKVVKESSASLPATIKKEDKEIANKMVDNTAEKVLATSQLSAPVSTVNKPANAAEPSPAPAFEGKFNDKRIVSEQEAAEMKLLGAGSSQPAGKLIAQAKPQPLKTAYTPAVTPPATEAMPSPMPVTASAPVGFYQAGYFTNPAYIGQQQGNNVHAVYQNQNPKAGQGPIASTIAFNSQQKKLAIGVGYTYFNEGVTVSNSANLAAAYKFTITGKDQLSIGASLDLARRTADLSSLNTDVLGTENKLSRNYAGLNAGAWYKHEQFYTGLAIQNINKPDIGYLGTSRLPMDIFVHTGYSFGLAPKLVMQPSLVYQRQLAFNYFSPELAFNYDKRWILGVGYTNLNSVSIRAGFAWYDKWLFTGGLAIAATKELRQYQTINLIEAGIHYKFGRKLSKQ